MTKLQKFCVGYNLLLGIFLTAVGAVAIVHKTYAGIGVFILIGGIVAFEMSWRTYRHIARNKL